MSMVGCATSSTPMLHEDAGNNTDLGSMVDDAGSTPMEILDAMLRDDADVDAAVASDASADAGDVVNGCVEGITAYLASFDTPGAATARSEDTECCTAIQASIDGDGSVWGEWSDANLRAYCCGTVFNWTSDGSCTPWGPPMPPAMPSLDGDEAFV